MTSELPLVSVIVPSYNHERFVRQTIESILNQSYQRIELFVVDDGSKDNSATVLKELSQKHGFFFEQQENKGLILTLNKLLGMCRGQYISMIASDDMMLPDKIEKQVKYMEEHPDVGASFGNMLMIDAEGKILPWYYQRRKQYKEVSFEDLITRRVLPYACTNIYRKEVYDKLGVYDSQYALEDLYMILRIAYNNYKISILPDLLAYYRIHNKNISNQFNYIFKEHLKTLRIYKGEKGYRTGVIKMRITKLIYRLMSILPIAFSPFKK